MAWSAGVREGHTSRRVRAETAMFRNEHTGSALWGQSLTWDMAWQVCGATGVDNPSILLSRPPSPHLAWQDGANPLCMASSKGHAAVVDLLIAAQADIESTLKARPRVRARSW